MKRIFLIFLLTALLFPFYAIAQDKEITTPIFGNISTKLSLPIIGMFLGLVDGLLNPCAISVLFFLIGYLMLLGSRKKGLQLGLIYSFTIFLVYFLFMYGILNVVSIIGYLTIIKAIIATVALIIGVIEIKDFFWYGKGFVLGISKSAKPIIKRLVEIATIPSAILLGFFVSLVEIPCAGAFPFIYITLLAENVSGGENLIYLVLYNFYFILPLLILTIIFYFGWLKIEKAEKTRLKIRKYMRLIAGIIMIILGISMLLNLI
ncbi:MAG: hypothetical protein QXQ18_01630 [Candidatus Aenigmatarchaeota archaeon]